VTYPVAVDGVDPEGIYRATVRFNVTVHPNQCPTPATLEWVSPAPASWSEVSQIQLINTLQLSVSHNVFGRYIGVSIRVGQSRDPDGDELRFFAGPHSGRAPMLGQPGLNKVYVRADEGEVWVSVDDYGLKARTSMNYKVISYAQAVSHVEGLVRADRTLGRRQVGFLQLLRLIKRVAADPVFSNTSYNPLIRKQKAAAEKSLRYLLKLTDGWLAQQPLVPASLAHYRRCLGSLTAAISR
jgi:hypothetical protein